MPRSALLRILAACAAALMPLPAVAQVVTDHLIGEYATTQDRCADPDFEIRRGVVDGPSLHCIFGAMQTPAPGGTESYESRCRQGDEVHFGTLTFDLSDKADHTRISLPENQDWITLYPCK
jgi:hypothetical protein